MKILQMFLIIFFYQRSSKSKHTKSLNIDQTEDPITRSIEQSKSHPSIVAIKSKITNKYFKFNSISKPETEKKVLNLDSTKTCQDCDILTKIIKFNSRIFLIFRFQQTLRD